MSNYKTLSEYNKHNQLIASPDISPKVYDVYTKYDTHMCNCTCNDKISKGKVTFVYTPESDSNYKNPRCS